MSQDQTTPAPNHTKAKGFAITTAVLAVISIILGLFPYANIAGSILGALSLIFAIIVLCLNLKNPERLSKITLLLAIFGLVVPIATQFVYHTTPNAVLTKIEDTKRKELYENSDLKTSYNSYAEVYNDTAKEAKAQMEKSKPEIEKASDINMSDQETDHIIDTEVDKMEKIFDRGDKNMENVLFKHVVQNKNNDIIDLEDAYSDNKAYASDARRVDPNEYKEYEKWEKKLADLAEQEMK
ncbi:hypothetical protein JOC36_000539 [Weissella uvarum]|uniref:hypothetical protein n=1 Tax=Weissella uvarum TaxID=1479233 RepID=UPI00195FD891|nr:hypothetical protein [Weissella uvarum]MBM7616990.1 hypothetical protein [Weissella uvarum]MCM0595290.1 hypothetical protein [Weissella uvarum]